jgi:glycosyltransferase involved in cell wall biosynthesis
MGRKYRVLLIASHPIQYAAPLYRLMAKHPQLDILVAYCSLQGAEKGVDPGFGVEVAWDVPLLEGYPWVHVPNRSPRPGIDRFFGLINPGLWKLVRQGRFDCLIVYGYAYLSFWLAILSAKSARIPLILATDATCLAPRDGRGWKIPLKRILLPRIFGLADIVCAPSSATIEFLRSLGIPEDCIVLCHYTVDNDYFAQATAKVNRIEVRQRWNIPDDAVVILFCGKLVPWKRPQDVLRAFAAINQQPQVVSNPVYLIYAGEGILRQSLEIEAKSLGVTDRVRFLGFVNQSRLPEVYAASDLLVLPSEYDSWGLVVNEAMVCGLPVIVSDRVGAERDLVRPGETGEIYPVGNVAALSSILRRLLADPTQLKRMGEAARRRMETWSYRECIAGYVEAIEKAVHRGGGGRETKSKRKGEGKKT